MATDPFVDLHTYYDAGTRLNAGEPLYDPNATESKGLYLYCLLYTSPSPRD